MLTKNFLISFLASFVNSLFLLILSILSCLTFQPQSQIIANNIQKANLNNGEIEMRLVETNPGYFALIDYNVEKMATDFDNNLFFSFNCSSDFYFNGIKITTFNAYGLINNNSDIVPFGISDKFSKVDFQDILNVDEPCCLISEQLATDFNINNEEIENKDCKIESSNGKSFKIIGIANNDNYCTQKIPSEKNRFIVSNYLNFETHEFRNSLFHIFMKKNYFSNFSLIDRILRTFYTSDFNFEVNFIENDFITNQFYYLTSSNRVVISKAWVFSYFPIAIILEFILLFYIKKRFIFKNAEKTFSIILLMSLVFSSLLCHIFNLLNFSIFLINTLTFEYYIFLTIFIGFYILECFIIKKLKLSKQINYIYNKFNI